MKTPPPAPPVPDPPAPLPDDALAAELDPLDVDPLAADAPPALAPVEVEPDEPTLVVVVSELAVSDGPAESPEAQAIGNARPATMATARMLLVQRIRDLLEKPRGV